MKNTFLLVAMMCLGWTMNASAQEEVVGAEISFEKDVHDYGTIKQGDNGLVMFKFTNTGSEPLIISNAKGSCQCTVPKWPQEPIAPGETGEIQVKYNTKRVGPINKSVTLTSNAVNAPTKTLRITGNVQAVEESVPVNKSGPAAQ